MAEMAQEVEKLGHEMPILTRRVAPQCRSLLEQTNVTELKCTKFLTGVHLIDNAIDVSSSTLLGRRARLESADAICAWAEASLPAVWYYKQVARGPIPCFYYCLQPPEFVYTQTRQVMRGYPPLGYLIPLLAPFYRRMDRHWARSADKLFCLSTNFQQRCREIYELDEVPIIPPGISQQRASDSRVAELRQRHAISDNEKVLVTVNKLIPKKNVNLFILMIDELRHTMPNVRGIVVGEGPQKEKLKELVAGRQLERWIDFTGFLESRDDVRAYQRMCDLYVFLEKKVPFGMTPLEAGVQQRPTLAFRGGGTLDTVIEEETGALLCEEAGTTEIANKARELLSNDGQLKSMGEAAARHAESFAWKICAHRFVESIRRSLERPREPQPASL